MSEHDYDPEIVDYVTAVANRYGVQGLEDMIKLAQDQLETARAALAELGEQDPSEE